MNQTIMTTKEVSETLGCSEQYVRRLLKDHKISGMKSGKTWLIPVEVTKVLQQKIISQIGVKNQKSKISLTQKEGEKMKALSFFSGAMGLDIGLHRAGIKTLLACEVDKASRKTILSNNPEIGLIGDIRDYSTSEILEYSGLNEGDKIDLIVGGPPCQAFSTAGKRMGFEDERGNVFLKFIEVIEQLKPTYAVLENVRGLLSSKITIELPENGFNGVSSIDKELPGEAMAYIIGRLQKAGYTISFNLYNSANFGTPQIRERVVIICSLKGKVPYLEPTHSQSGNFGLPKWKTLKDALENLPTLPKDFVKFPEKRLKYYRLLKPGEYWRNLPEYLQKEAMGLSYHLSGGKTGFYRRLDWNKPSPTIVTHPAMPATDLCHPVEDRPLSVQEYKRIQEFPDSWEICGSIIEQYRQIGNAVPVSLGNAVGIAIAKHNNGIATSNQLGFKYSRYNNTSDLEFMVDLEKRKNNAKSTQMELF